MTIDEHICSGGIATVPDLRGSRDCYGDDYDTMVITQTPEPGEQVGAGQTIINVLTEDGNGNATLCTHYLNVTADNPAPTLICPGPISAWLLTGGYAVPDLTTEIEILGGCTVYDDLVITQSPPAGTLITNAGTHTVTITVEDEFGHDVVCGSTTITLREPSVVNPVSEPPDVPTETPGYIYTTNLLAYWPFDDITLYRDVSYLYNGGGTPRNLTAGAGAEIKAPDSVLGSCWLHSPGPVFGRGSFYINQDSTDYASRASDSALKLMGTSFTIRFGLKIVQLTGVVCFHIVSKLSGVSSGDGYRILVCNGPYIQAQLVNPTNNLTTPAGAVTIANNVWYHIAVTFDNALGSMKIYTDGALRDTRTSAGFLVGDSFASPFYVGPPNFGNQVEAYIDELGIWTEAWDAARVLDDYHIISCMT